MSIVFLLQLMVNRLAGGWLIDIRVWVGGQGVVSSNSF